MSKILSSQEMKAAEATQKLIEERKKLAFEVQKRYKQLEHAQSSAEITKLKTALEAANKKL